MARMNHLLLKLAVRARNLKQNVKGQDLIEYALMAGFVAVAAGALMPNIAQHQHRFFEDHIDSDRCRRELEAFTSLRRPARKLRDG